MKTIKRRFAVALILVLAVALLLPTFAGAYSIPTTIHGVTACGAIVLGDASVQVRGRSITFDVAEYEYGMLYSDEKYAAYACKVTTEYEFVNPNDADTSVTLALPVGQTPDYGRSGLYDNEGKFTPFKEYNYSVKADGVDVDYTVRHTYANYIRTGEDYEAASKLIAEGYVQNDVFSPDLACTSYTFEVRGVDVETEYLTDAECNIGMGDVPVITDFISSFESNDDGYTIGNWVRNGDRFQIVFVGDEGFAPQFKFYNWASDDRVEVDGYMNLVEKKSLTFEELVAEGYDDAYNVAPTDWYNAVVTELSDSAYLGSSVYSANSLSLDYDKLLKWYVYEISVPAGQSVTHTVTTPLFPGVDRSYRPDMLVFTYCFDGAKWGSAISVSVSTPYFMLGENAQKFQKVDNGYEFFEQNPADDTLQFQLCASENPEKVVSPLFYISIIFVLLFFFFAGLLVISPLIALAIGLAVRHRKQKVNLQLQAERDRENAEIDKRIAELSGEDKQ